MAANLDADKRRKIAHEVEQLSEALSKIKADQAALEKLAARPMAADFNPRLRKLEGADFDSPFNFAWRLDYADILGPRAAVEHATLKDESGLVIDVDAQQSLTKRIEERGGFDLILGNPPFVTARNPVKRELYRERWRRVCAGSSICFVRSLTSDLGCYERVVSSVSSCPTASRSASLENL